ncbi:MAG TPA: DUF2169 domain-containing protein, partial [Polyangiaceae bacterium]|nr:DUF2169 domain-containing protein [Polyangiaceae bacterium]
MRTSPSPGVGSGVSRTSSTRPSPCLVIHTARMAGIVAAALSLDERCGRFALMQVVSLAPVPVASLAWRVGDGAWALGVVCKLTFQLTPGQAKLAKRHDPIYERERFPDGNEHASLYAPSDLIPTRPLTDVTLVGSAYAPRGKPTSSIDVRLRIQTIDKSL